MSQNYKKKKGDALTEPLLFSEDEKGTTFDTLESDINVELQDLNPSNKSMPTDFSSGKKKISTEQGILGPQRSKSYEPHIFGGGNYFRQQTLRYLDLNESDEELKTESPLLAKHAFDNVRDADDNELEINYELQKKRGFERQNFDPVENEISHLDSLRISLRGKKISSRGLLKWFTCIVVGFMTGMCMVFVTFSVGNLQDVLWSWYRNALNSGGFGYGFLVFYIFSLGMALVAGICVWISPRAAGSGIPEVKAYLNGSSIPALFYFKTLISKLVGVIGAVSGSFMIGKEGPMVHSGAALASQIGRAGIYLMPRSFATKFLFGTDLDKRDLISCGAAAGVSAAAFGAPIGGMVCSVYI